MLSIDIKCDPLLNCNLATGIIDGAIKWSHWFSVTFLCFKAYDNIIYNTIFDEYFPNLCAMTFFSSSECTSLTTTWSQMVPDKTFPVVHGTVLTLSCKDGHQMNGDKEVTCIVGTEFSYSETNSPECGKYYGLVLKSLNSQSVRLSRLSCSNTQF